MKHILASLLSFVAGSALAASTTLIVPPGSFTNLLSVGPAGYAKITAVSVSANTTNAAVALVDSVTNSLTYTVGAYTNKISYATNLVQSWTNYFGVVNSWTNMTLVDIDNPVAATTNSYPIRANVAALASTTTTINPASYVFENGVWVTNTSSGIATITINYVQ